MDPITIALIGMGINVVGGVIGYLLESGRAEEAQKLVEAAQAKFGEVTDATLDEAAKDVLPPSELARIQTDPQIRQTQMGALDKMRQLEERGGLTLEDEALLNRVQNEAANQNRGMQARMFESFRNRGVGGSGMEMATRAQAGQAAANASRQTGLDIAGMAQKRYFDAVRSRFGMAGDLRGQEWAENSAKAKAQDEINRLNQNQRNQVRAGRQRAAENQMGFANQRAGFQNEQGQRLGRAVSGTAAGIGQMAGAPYASEYGSPGAPRVPPARSETEPVDNYDYNDWYR